MPVKFNSGKGAVICKECQVIIDEDLTSEDYKYYATHPGEHICMGCKDASLHSCADCSGRQSK